ncbi:MAG: GDSL-type esterase/lipase family protein [Polyangiales bacterium]|nr:hypothetical protein [Myxococcales bacterium]
MHTSDATVRAADTVTDEVGVGEIAWRYDGDTVRAFRHLGVAAAVMLAFVPVVYAIPALERARPWVAGEAIPLVDVFRHMHEKSVPSIASGTDVAAGAASTEVLDDAVQKNLDAAAPKAPKHREAPFLVDPDEYADIAVEIEGKEHLAPFFAALRKSAHKEKGAITRIAHFGDSSVASDEITGKLRQELQMRFGDAGHGFVLVDRGHMPYSHKDIYMRGGHGWELRQLVNNESRDGFYGLGGVKYRPGGSSWATFGTMPDGPTGTKFSRFEVYYRSLPRSGRVVLTVDRKQKEIIETRGDEGDKVAVIELPDGAHRVDLRPDGFVELYGVVLERKGPGVVYDSLGMVGARARRLMNFDPEHIAGQLEHRNPDLIVLGFGGNEADDNAQAIKNHEADVREVIQLLRKSRPKQACLVFAPLDQAHRNGRGEIATFKSIPTIVDAQRRAAKAEGCAFFDTFTAMGGEGTMGRWTRTRPRLAVSDLRHATPAGYDVIATLFYKALLKAFAESNAGAKH